ncbi:hypothetical protein C8F04DRAFT_1185707 [Mycena alexandri]|uniref:Uncharacterized protein n=1 Tax=Mycena alexandri TaxID=1745969 RepID=A0AAD6SQI5_9AGAR|nr:hypothetical protein C8F04DRAFT_1185707 [Mycena alexandri]
MAMAAMDCEGSAIDIALDPTNSQDHERITNSPLIRSLPWSIDGMDCEEFLSWHRHGDSAFQKLCDSIRMATATDGKLPPASTATQRQAYARYIYGFDAVNTGASKSYPSEQHTIFALQLLQLFAEHIGLPKVKDRRMMPRFASLPTILLGNLSDWPTVIEKVRGYKPPQRKQVVSNLKIVASLLSVCGQGEFPIADVENRLGVGRRKDWTCNDYQLLTAFQLLGHHPPALVQYEQALTAELWKLMACNDNENAEGALQSFLYAASKLQTGHSNFFVSDHWLDLACPQRNSADPTPIPTSLPCADSTSILDSRSAQATAELAPNPRGLVPDLTQLFVYVPEPVSTFTTIYPPMLNRLPGVVVSDALRGLPLSQFPDLVCRLMIPPVAIELSHHERQSAPVHGPPTSEDLEWRSDLDPGETLWLPQYNEWVDLDSHG